jgi:drug/metabolite transporter (DMT)-like permease
MSNPPSPRLSISGTDWALIVALGTIWGSNFFFAKIAVQEIPPLTLTLGRVFIATAALAPFAWAIRRGAVDLRDWRGYLIMGLLNTALPSALVYWGQTYITAGLASILNATSPLFSIVVAHMVTSDDKLTRARVIGLILGFSGVVIVIGPDLLREVGTHVAAQIACLLGPLCYAVAAIYGRRFRGHPPLAVATGQLGASTLIIAPVALLIDKPWTLAAPSLVAVAAMVGIALLSTALAYVIYFRLLARTGATNALLVTFLVPVSAVLLSTSFLGERLELRQFVGMVAILGALAALDGRPAQLIARAFRRARRASASPDRA